MDVQKDGVAASAGLKARDIIVAVNGQVLDIRNPLDVVIQKHQAGEQVTLQVLRGSQTLQVPIILGEQK